MSISYKYKYNNIVKKFYFFLKILLQSKNDETSKAGVSTRIVHVEHVNFKRDRRSEVELCHCLLEFKIKYNISYQETRYYLQTIMKPCISHNHNLHT